MYVYVTVTMYSFCILSILTACFWRNLTSKNCTVNSLVPKRRLCIKYVN